MHDQIRILDERAARVADLASELRAEAGSAATRSQLLATLEALSEEAQALSSAVTLAEAQIREDA